MRIGIIGSGNIGSTAAKLFVEAGHEVAIANSRGPESLREVVAGLGDRAHAATPEDAAVFGEVVLVAIPFGRYRDLPAGALAGRIVIDANNYYPERDGQIPELDSGETTSSELAAGHLPGARLVKAFNTMYYERLRDEGRPRGEQRLATFVAGDDVGAKAVASGLIDEVGFEAVDVGSLADGRRQQPGTETYDKPLTADEARRALEASGG